MRRWYAIVPRFIFEGSTEASGDRRGHSTHPHRGFGEPHRRVLVGARRGPWNCSRTKQRAKGFEPSTTSLEGSGVGNLIIYEIKCYGGRIVRVTNSVLPGRGPPTRAASSQNRFWAYCVTAIVGRRSLSLSVATRSIGRQAVRPGSPEEPDAQRTPHATHRHTGSRPPTFPNLAFPAPEIELRLPR